ncbi:MAG TPA: NADH-ubiquinone oxidoreductase-F iron-sulfur binding region domain-containing protein, partial [Candidatus Binataceae bacterium]|nr:NADH-ubiquinone oxidoreductase-F iron-sulfur binding region domain-containing protein [Candidatus Binataceae bacterium]
EIIRNGSRGLYFLEPLVEVATPSGRTAYGPVSIGDVASLFEHQFVAGGDHSLRLGRPEDIPYLRTQERRIFARVGIVDPKSLAEYVTHGGYRALDIAISKGPAAIIEEITTSGLRGHGGAGFPTGVKWRTVLETTADLKYIVCNADEGDSGSFSDRMLMEGDPFALLEGMTIAAVTVGATLGFIYVRSEYPDAFRGLSDTIETARSAGYLGRRVLGSRHDFDIELRSGAGSYVCGEETAMLESIEGKRGMVRAKPPVPAIGGLFGKPTVVNNVITFASVPAIIANGAESFRSIGTGRSRGTLPIQISGNVKRPGLIEKAFGVTLREIVNDYGHGTASGKPLRAVQVGGPLGAYFPVEMLDTLIDYEAMDRAGGILGHGGVVVFDDTANLARMARNAMEFCAQESCGKCTPCRIGSVRGVELIDRIIRGRNLAADLRLLEDLCATLKFGSLCALGGLAPLPILSALRYFPEDFGRARIEDPGDPRSGENA